MWLIAEGLPVKDGRPDGSGAKVLKEVLSNDFLLIIMWESYAVISLQAMDVIFPRPWISTQLEEFCVSISKPNVSEAWALPNSCFLNEGQTNGSNFEPFQ